MYMDRGTGIFDLENTLMGVIFISVLGFLCYTHFLISKSVIPQNHTVFSTVSTINVLLALATTLSYSFGSNHGDLVTYMLIVLMLATLFVSVLISIKIIIKKQF